MDHFNLKTVFFIFSFISLISVNGQDTTSTNLEQVDVFGKKFGLKKTGLYDNELEDDLNVRGFTKLTIFENDLTDEFWTSGGKTCINGALATTDGRSYLKLNWNKDLDGCDWVGMGFGWDGWTGKDMGYVIDTLAIELVVRSTGKSFTNIPWAFCFEDYGGKQAWLGYNKSFLMSNEITTAWTRVEIPLSLFPFAENEVDLTSIKQLMIQVFAEGVIEIQHIRLIPFSKKLKKEVHAVHLSLLPKIDGALTDWNTSFSTFGSGHQFSVGYSADSLYLAIKVMDASPRNNGQTGNNLWNGDAIEIAFSTNVNADPKRKFLLLSDQHIGINSGKNTYLWDWKEDTSIESINYKIKSNETGYLVEMAIPFKALYQLSLVKGLQLDFEIAVDLSSTSVRDSQERWNSSYSEGFNITPQKWGILIFD
jgi:hypothetical protein